jgi:hypothetical protein
MELFPEPGVRGIRLVFEDAGAVYPVIVDPMTTNPAWTTEPPDPDYGWFTTGYTVGTAGDVNDDGYDDIIFGIPEYPGGAGFNEGLVVGRDGEQFRKQRVRLVGFPGR